MPEAKFPVTIRLGSVDQEPFEKIFQSEDHRSDYFKQYHERFWGLDHWYENGANPPKPDLAATWRDRKIKFRGEANDHWVTPNRPQAREDRLPVSGNEVARLQTFLRDAGFLPDAEIDGIFDYYTLSGFRLFQEYVRSVEKDDRIGKPDGIVGTKGWAAVERWPEGKVCEWGVAYEKMKKAKASLAAQNEQPSIEGDKLDFASSEFKRWLKTMREARDFYKEQLANASPSELDENLELYQLNLVEQFEVKCDTKPMEEWSFNAKDPHLLGIRCNHERGILNRENDDLFVLLLNGMVFHFWGSTDPNPKLAHQGRSKGDEPFLVEGHHKYKFGWHKLNPTQVYGGLHPYSNGVMVFRDRDNDNALTEEDIRAGLDKKPNTTINIHWSGKGDFNYSAGCQVISGKSYINHRGEVVDCSEFASTGYSGLENKTRGAYNVLADLVFVYSPPGVDYIYYTLGQDGTLDLVSPELSSEFAHEKVAQMKGEELHH